MAAYRFTRKWPTASIPDYGAYLQGISAAVISVVIVMNKVIGIFLPQEGIVSWTLVSTVSTKFDFCQS